MGSELEGQASGVVVNPPIAEQEGFEKARLIVEAALELKAENPVVIDMRKLTSYADVFVILSGRSDRHVRSVADSIVHALREADEAPLGVEGQDEGRWVLIDANDVVVHVFDPDTREHFDLERLWSDAPTVDVVADLGIAYEAEPDATSEAS
jgi:ribosome-associated protein